MEIKFKMLLNFLLLLLPLKIILAGSFLHESSYSKVSEFQSSAGRQASELETPWLVTFASNAVVDVLMSQLAFLVTSDGKS